MAELKYGLFPTGTQTKPTCFEALFASKTISSGEGDTVQEVRYQNFFSGLRASRRNKRGPPDDTVAHWVETRSLLGRLRTPQKRA